VSLRREECARHPDAGAPLVGSLIPFWYAVVELAGAALSVFPCMLFAGLDLSHTEFFGSGSAA
jgi:hypothetical protein